MNMETQCCNERCKAVLAPGQIVYEIGPYRYCDVCVKVNVVRYPRLVPEQRRGNQAVVLP